MIQQRFFAVKKVCQLETIRDKGEKFELMIIVAYTCYAKITMKK